MDPIVSLDWSIARQLNLLSSVASPLNRIIVATNDSAFLKTAPFIFVLVWFWNRPPLAHHRDVVLRGIAGAIAGLATGRLLQVTLPFRARPIHDTALGLTLPPGIRLESLGGINSLPSDHGTLFGALTGLMFALSPPLGILTGLYTAFVVLGSRVYLGEHFLSDVTAGALIGLLCAWIAQRAAPIGRIAAALRGLADRHPAPFYAAAIMLVAQLGQMFNDLRAYATALRGLLASH